MKDYPISCGWYHSLVLDSEGRVFSFGDNEKGQLGLGDNENKNNPQVIPNVQNITQISCRGYHSLVLDSEGRVFSFGYNKNGQLGLGDNKDKNYPQMIPNLQIITQIKENLNETKDTTQETTHEGENSTNVRYEKIDEQNNTESQNDESGDEEEKKSDEEKGEKSKDNSKDEKGEEKSKDNSKEEMKGEEKSKDNSKDEKGDDKGEHKDDKGKDIGNNETNIDVNETLNDEMNGSNHDNDISETGLPEEKMKKEHGEKKSGSETFSEEIIGLVDHKEITSILDLQVNIHQHLHDSVESLTQFNLYGTDSYNNLQNDYEKHTKMMKEMKKDLDYIFRKIRVLKENISNYKNIS